MSFLFHIDAPDPPRYREVLEDLDLDGLECLEGQPEAERWPAGTRHFYLPGVSCRAVEVTYEDRGFEVRILACSGPEDYETAFRLVEALAGRCESPVRPENGEPFPTGALRQRFGEGWVAAQIRSSFEVIALLVAKDGSVVRVSGPKASVHFGPKTQERLKAAGREDGLPRRMMELLLRAQNLEAEGYFPANEFEVSSKGTGKSVTAAFWSEGSGYLFPPVEYLILRPSERDKDFVFLPFPALPELAGEKCRWFDDKQALVEPFVGEEWLELVARARKRGGNPLG